MRYPTILLALFCVACGSYSANVPTIKPYKMDVQQGNVVTSKMMMQLRPGMSKSQVRFIMGTPLLMDSFHADQWDYFYQMRKGGKIIEQRRIVLKFDGDKLARVSGDVIPATGDSVAEPAVQPKPGKTAKEKGLLDRLKFWGDDEETPKASAQPAQKQEQVAPVPAATPPKPEPAGKATEPAEPAPAASAEPASPAPEPVPEQPAQPAVAEPVPSAPEPVKAEPEPVKPEPAAETKPVPPAQSPAPASRKAPEPAPKEVEAPRTTEKAPAQAPAAKPAAAEERRMTAPLPPDDLPPEDAPDFFEKMLEKIGF